MDKKMFQLLFLIILILVGIFAYMNFLKQNNVSDVMGGSVVMDKEVALQYAKAWAESVHGDFNTLTLLDNGDFYGIMDTSIGFEYINTDNLLIIRAVIKPFGSSLLQRQDIMNELHRIEEKDPKSVANAKFELILGKWQTRQEPSLYLRLDIKNQAISINQFITNLKELGDVAFLWNSTYFSEVVDGLNMIAKGTEKLSEYKEIVREIISKNDIPTYGVWYDGETNDIKYFQNPARISTGYFYHLFDISGNEILKTKDYKTLQNLTKNLYMYSMIFSNSSQ